MTPTGRDLSGASTSTWTAIGPVSTLTPATIIDAIVVSPLNPQVLLAGGQNGTGVFKSTDGGSSWILTLDNPFGFYTRAIAVDPTSPTIVYAGGYGEIYRSIDTGSTWTSLNGTTYPPPGEVRGIAIDPTNPDTIYVGIYLGGIAKTTDAGATWTTMNVGMGPAPVQAVVVDPVDSNTLYAGVRGHGIYKSTDAAASWRRLLTDDPTPRLGSSLAIDPTNPLTMYVGDWGQFGSVLKTVDGGVTWRVVGAAISDSVAAVSVSWADTNAVLLDPNHPATVYAGTFNAGVFVSEDGGDTWRELNEGLSNLHVSTLAIAPGGATLYAGTMGDGAFARSLRAIPLDSTAPVITVDAAPAAHDGWNNSDVTVTWSVTDTESGIASTSNCGTTTVTGETTSTTFTCSAQNGAGLSASHAITVKVDRTRPTIIASAWKDTYSGTLADQPYGEGAWTNGNVVLHFTCADTGGSGLAEPCPSDEMMSSDGVWDSKNATVTDRAGNSSAPSGTFNVRIDKTAPSITFAGNLESYTVDQMIAISCAATDSLSGISATTCPAVVSAPATNYVGVTATTASTVTVGATDNAGNTVSASSTFTVSVTAGGICRLSVALTKADEICSKATSIETAGSAATKASRLNAFDNFIAAQSGKSIPPDFAQLLSRLAHLL